MVMEIMTGYSSFVGCPQTDLTRVGVGYPESVTKGWVATPVPTSRNLILSNYPETVESTATLPANLYWIWLTMPPSGALSVRVFFWHGHLFASSKRFWLVGRLEGVDATGQVSNHKRIYGYSHRDQIHETGLCCAKALRNNTITEDLVEVTLDPDTDVKLYDLAHSYLVPPRDRAGIATYFGAVHHFTITAPANSRVQLRTVISAGQDIGSHLAKPIDGGPEHPRGWWPYSDLSVQASSPINLATSLPRVYMVCAALNNPDSNRFTRHPDDEHGFPASGNKGLYGVNATYNVSFENDGTHRILNGYLRRASNVPDDSKYFGSLTGNPCGIPPLQPGTTLNSIKLLDEVLVTDKELPLLNLNNTVAGASSTPFELFFTWVNA